MHHDDARSRWPRPSEGFSVSACAVLGGLARAQIAVNIESLREQHEWWSGELETYFKDRSPDLSWEQTEHALDAAAKKIGAGLD